MSQSLVHTSSICSWLFAMPLFLLVRSSTNEFGRIVFALRFKNESVSLQGVQCRPVSFQNDTDFHGRSHKPRSSRQVSGKKWFGTILVEGKTGKSQGHLPSSSSTATGGMKLLKLTLTQPSLAKAFATFNRVIPSRQWLRGLPAFAIDFPTAAANSKYNLGRRVHAFAQTIDFTSRGPTFHNQPEPVVG